MKLLSFISLGAALSLASTAIAQQDRTDDLSYDPEREKVRIAIVYGDDVAPVAEDPNEIVVIARLPESERYRVPDVFRGGGPVDPRNQAWTQKAVALERTGRFGTYSCSTAGVGGFLGCQEDIIASAVAERKAESKTDWTALVAKARAERMAEFDEAAAEVEAAVVAEEQAMEERRLAAEAAARAEADRKEEAERLERAAEQARSRAQGGDSNGDAEGN